MFKASDFTYDGVYSAVYGLKIATLNGQVITNATYAVPTIATAKPAKSKRFFYQDIIYANPPVFEFSILSEKPITDLAQREILTWLDSRSGFKKLKIHQPEFDGYTYNCIFTISNIIYHASRCIGFTLRATFDSIYQYGKSTTKTISGNGTEQRVEIYNRSDVLDTYVYPQMSFVTSSYVEGNKNIVIVNETDNADRKFIFTNIPLNAEVRVDNELKIMNATGANTLLSNFNKNWLRLKKGKNILSIKINGTATITCPNYAKIRF